MTWRILRSIQGLMRRPKHSVPFVLLLLALGLGAGLLAVVGMPPAWTRPAATSDAWAQYFSRDYVAARARFRERVAAARGRLDSLSIDARGPRGEALAIDVAWFGEAAPRRVLLHSSGIHGVEGFAGSAIQLQFLEAFPGLGEGSAIALVHIVNPYGMAWLRRVNEDNVDLNRNFLGPSEDYAGVPAGYSALDPLLNPTGPPTWDFFLPRAIWRVARDGMTPLKQAAASGQYEYPRGLFFGGKRLQRGPELLQAYLKERLAGAERIVAIDVHTGLGRYGEDILLAEPIHADALRRIFGARVTPLDPGQGAAYRARGAYGAMLSRAMTWATVYFVAQEFGTYKPLHVVRALREENRWHHFGNGRLDHPTKRELKETFAPSDSAWRGSVLARGKTLMQEAIALAFR